MADPNYTPVNSTTAGQLIAAQLSQAAYTPLTDYVSLSDTEWVDSNNVIQSLPPGWRVDLTPGQSGSNANTQFTTFVNTTTHQVVIAFRGTTLDNFDNAYSDLANDGATHVNLEATDWGGTTLTGNDEDGQSLTATTGDNTLTAGGGGTTFNLYDDDNTASATGGNNTFNLLGAANDNEEIRVMLPRLAPYIQRAS